MSGVITSSSFAKLLWPGLNAIYGKEYNDYAVEWDKLFEKNIFLIKLMKKILD